MKLLFRAPARPKRFAWTLGFMVVALCLIFFLVGQSNGFRELKQMMELKSCMEIDSEDIVTYPVAEAMLMGIKILVMICLVLTWLEGNCGFCVGCFIYNSFSSCGQKRISSLNTGSDIETSNKSGGADHCEVCVY